MILIHTYILVEEHLFQKGHEAIEIPAFGRGQTLYEDVCKKKVPRAVFHTQNDVQVGQEHESDCRRVVRQVNMIVYEAVGQNLR